MYFLPLNQLESVELVIHALRAAGGEVDCAACPARKVCTRQCLSIAAALAKMAEQGTLPSLEDDPEPPPASPGPANGGLRVVK